MLHLRHVLHVLPILFLAGACGGRTGDDEPSTHEPGPPVGPIPTTPEPLIYRGAVSGATDGGSGLLLGGSVQILAIQLDSGTAVPFGPPLPAPVDGTYLSVDGVAVPGGRVVARAVATIRIDSSGTRSLGPSLFFVGDGVTWRELRRISAPLGGWTSSLDGSLAAMRSPCPGDTFDHPLASFEVFDVDGSSRWQTPCGATELFAGFAPDASYFGFVASDDLAVRALAGAEASVAPVGAAPSYLAMFPTSLVVRSGDGKAGWFDSTGAPLAVAGFAADGHLGGGAYDGGLPPFQIAGGELSLLHDRALEPIQRVPDWVAEQNVQAILPGHYVIVRDDDDSTLRLIGSDGRELDTVHRDGFGVGVWAGSLTTPWPWMIVRFAHFTPTLANDVGDIDNEDELWLPGDPAAGIAGRRFPTPVTFAVRPSPTGRYALVSGDGGLHRLDPSTGVSVAIGSQYQRIYDQADPGL